ncbi:MAG: aminopeptidase [Clostridia bacterium]|nr:aminopeptidase [Clostridia bacterium]
MIAQQTLEEYAKIALEVGVNLQKNQILILTCPIEGADLAREVVKHAYEMGAKKVTIKWSDDFINRTAMENESLETLQEVPQYTIEQCKYEVDNKVAFLFITGAKPSLYAGIDTNKIKVSNMARMKALHFWGESRSTNYCRWTIISYPTVGWAKEMFPDDDDQTAVKKLWAGIEKAMRLDQPNPTEAWIKHIALLQKRSEFLNENSFDYIHLLSKNGTDLKVGLANGHIWNAAGETDQDGLPFTANMPTEEIFTAPHKHNVNGIVYSAMPLCLHGTIVDDFSLTFKDGKIVDFTAEKGYETLKNAIETDEGSHHLGEIALIGKNSAICSQHILFYNTLFDENASCHLAFGNGYPTTVKDGVNMDEEQKDANGLNSSLTHIDFMIGTSDIDIFGVKANGEKIRLFADGEWII